MSDAGGFACVFPSRLKRLCIAPDRTKSQSDLATGDSGRSVTAIAEFAGRAAQLELQPRCHRENGEYSLDHDPAHQTHVEILLLRELQAH